MRKIFIKKLYILAILFWIIILFWNILHIYAESSVNMSTSELKVAIWGDFDLNIEIKSDSDKWINITSLSWLDNFNKLSTQSSESFQMINWKLSFWRNIKYTLRALTEGDFTIWPIIINDWIKEVTSGIVNISVLEFNKFQKNNTILNNGNIQNNKVSSDIDEEEDINKIIKKEDINSVRYFTMFYKDFIYIPIYIFIFLLIVYLILSKYTSKITFKKKNNHIKKENHNLILKNKLLKLSKELNHLNENEFYWKLNILFKKYFENIWIKEIFNLTLKELKEKGIKNNILNLFEESYYLEFSSKTSNIDTRKKIIHTFIDYLNEYISE